MYSILIFKQFAKKHVAVQAVLLSSAQSELAWGGERSGLS